MTVVNTSLYSVKAFVIIDNDGKRVIAKYFTNNGTPNAQILTDPKAFEKTLFEKSKKASSSIIQMLCTSSNSLIFIDEIMIMDGQVVVYRNNMDLFFYVVGSLDDNELILAQVLTCFYETISSMLKYLLLLDRPTTNQ